MQSIVSNDLTLLRESLAARLADMTGLSPLQEDWIIVPNRDTGRWLQTHLVTELGGLANTRFLTLGQALSELSGTDHNSSFFEVAFWAIAKYWQLAHPQLAAPDAVPQIVLLTELFERYLSDRPDWLVRWEREQTVHLVGPHWQATLWREIEKALTDQPHHRLLELANGARAPELQTVGRVFVFAPDRLSEVALQILKQISQHRPVGLWLMSPSPEGWFLERDAEALDDHPLLFALGAERARLMRQMSADTSIEAYCHPLDGQRHALAHLKHALYCNRQPEQPIDQDHSLQFLAATSPTQEVLALKAWIVHYLNQDPNHSLADIVIVSPDPGLYGPIVQRVFNDADARYPLSTAPDPLIQQPLHDVCVQFLCAMRRDGFRANRVLSFLTVEAVRSAFALTDRDIRQIESWLIASGARRGLDGHKHSLQAAKRRLLRGLLIDPLVCIEGDATPTEPLEQSLRLDILIAVFDAIEMIIQAPEKGSPSVLMAQISQCLHTLTLGQLKALEMPPIPAFADELSIDFQLLMAFFASQQRAGLSRPVALNDQISVTSPSTIRAMHWPVVAIVGANDGTFPAEPATHAWDLILKHPRSGDLIPQDAERQALLDILLNTDSHLWISWLGEHPISLENELPGAGVMAVLAALAQDPEAQTAWIQRAPTGLSMTPHQSTDPLPSPRPVMASQSQSTRHELLRTVVDPAAAFLKAKGGVLRSPPDDRLQQEPLALSPLDAYRVRDEFMQRGDRAQIANWLAHHPELPTDLEPDLADTFAPENIRIARAMQGPEFPPTTLELAHCALEIRNLPLASVPRFTSDEKPNRQRTLVALLDILMCFAVQTEEEPVDLVTFEGKIYRIEPLSRLNAQQLLSDWCDALRQNAEAPCPLITPLAIQHAEALAKDPETRIDLQWGLAPLVHKPHYRRLFANDPEIKHKHQQLVQDLVLPLTRLRARRSRNAF